MSRTDTSQWPCSIAQGVNVLGDAWNLLILRDACLGVRRFDQFQTNLGIGRGILTSHLRTLVEERLLERVPYQDRPVRHEYRLTDKGRDVYPILAAMAAWSDRWSEGSEGSPLTLHHGTCGHDMAAKVVCGECDSEFDVREMTARTGPGHPRSATTDS